MSEGITRRAFAAAAAGVAGIRVARGAGAREKVVILLLGAPGSGKTTQAKNLSRKYNVPALSMSDILKKESGWVKTELKKNLGAHLASGDLVNDEMANSLVEKYISKGKALDGFILDGYPKTARQAEYLEATLLRRGLPEPLVLHLAVPDNIAIERMERRGRADDKPEIIKGRLADYHAEEKFLLNRYRSRLRTVDGTPAEAAVWREIEKALATPAGR
jgi:adenylate kinase